MSDVKLSTRRQLELMQKLQQAADERARGENRIANALEGELTAAEQDRTTTADQVARYYTQRRRMVENEFAEVKNSIGEQNRQAKLKIEQIYEQERAQSSAAYKQMALAIERKKKEAEWQALAVYDAAKDKPGEELEAARKRSQSRAVQIDGLERDAQTLLAMRRQTKAAEADDAETSAAESDDKGPSPDATKEGRAQMVLTRVRDAVVELQNQRLPSLLLENNRWIGWWIAACLICAATLVGIAFWQGWSPYNLGGVGAAVGTGIVALVYWLLGPGARRQSLGLYRNIIRWIEDSRELEQSTLTESELRAEQLAAAIRRARDESLQAAEDARAQATEQNDARHKAEMQAAQSKLNTSLDQLKLKTQAALDAADAKYTPMLDQIVTERAADVDLYERQYAERTTTAQTQHDADWQAMAERWSEKFAEVNDELTAMRDQCRCYFPDWQVTSWSEYTRPEQPPEAMQFGSYRLPLSAVKNGVSDDPRLVPEVGQLEIPALMTIAEQPGLAITAAGEGRDAAIELIQAMMLRFLTALPAGKLRFTIIDPSGLGKNFATFMHLADHDEQLVGGRIWTDSRQIDERLAILCDHMEKVLQKYLRNQFETIHEYNRHAGEVSEPYHVVVVANFPAGLGDASIRRLKTIIDSGPRCGVYPLVSVDTAAKLPAEYQLDDLFAKLVQLDATDHRLKWRYPLFEKLPLKVDRLPEKDKLNELLRITAAESREASRVEVPFRVVAPAADQLWTESTAQELVVPIGRAGANDLQSLRLGRGTAQHAVISGKTGSGKSSLLHALVTNAALRFSPSEVEFYLVDFKKGVEFKAYATGALPHAKVIAIESEREFGVSVLERLDEELRLRGERFRDLGVQDLASARTACDDHLPRVLLIVDEFQELFVTDDKLAQDAALLLDRLVRQGRAFGIHVLLGSQTLAGAYSLARSTIGQMAVRIALECSESDAHLILSDENSAARLLSRPGEAIYNDENGLVEGNNLFQVVWLPDAERQKYLAMLREKTGELPESHEPPIVFEGNVPANPDDNPQLVATLETPPTRRVAEPTVWLGSAVRIEPPTQLVLRHQSGNNLIVVGQEERLALGILGEAVVAIAAQQPEARFTILDGARPESAEQGAWQEIAEALPAATEVFAPRQAGAAITALADEVARRGEAADGAPAPHYVLVHDLAQFRDLRLTEDDFSFSSFSSAGGEKSTPIDKQFRTLLKEGPAVGVHVLIWCDSYNSMTRAIDRLTLREIDFRVALQMSAGDSTSLIDTPAAGKIGEHRAILYRDDLGTQTKFRPYARPTAEWLAWVAERLGVRGVVAKG